MSDKKKILVWLENYSIHFGIAKAIQDKYDCDLFAVISCSPNQKSFFESQKLINFKKKWFTRDHVNLKKPRPNLENLELLEKSLDIKLSKIIYGDRLFYKFNKYYKFSDEEIYSIIEQELDFYSRVIDEISPDYVVLRAPEFQDIELFYEVCKAKKIPMLILSSMKFGTRWIISSEPYPPIKFNFSEEQIPIKSFKELRKDVQKYFKVYNSIFSPKGKIQSKKLQRLKAGKLLFSTFNSSNINSYHDIGKTPWSIFYNVIRTSVQREYRKKFLDKNTRKSISTSRSYGYFPLHVEPDVAILRIGDYYSDQINVIKNIAQSLPVGMKLFVKEHPSMWLVGWRNSKYYKKIIELPNVELIHHSITSESMIQNSSFVITISGTSALEAIFYEKPVIVFSDINCSTLSSVFKVEKFRELPNIIKKCLKTKIDLVELNHYFNQIEKSTFICNVEDLNVVSSNLFGMGGLLNMNPISETQMELFLEERKNEFNILAEEHIKKINYEKNKHNSMENNETYDN
jgi:hypothetical protein